MTTFKKTLQIAALLLIALANASQVYAASLTLNPATGTITKGCNVSIKIDLDTENKETDGTDVILDYDPAILSATTNTVTNGTIYQDYPGNAVDATNKKISISGISSVSSPFNGKGTFATINFTVSPSAQDGANTTLKFEFDPSNLNNTTDTNVVERGTIQDVLNKVVDGSYTVGSGGCTAGSGVSAGTGGNTVTARTQGSTDSSSSGSLTKGCLTIDQCNGGKSPGLFDNTFMLLGAGGAFVILGILGLALL